MKSRMSLLYGAIETLDQLLKIICSKFLIHASKKEDIVALEVIVTLVDKIMIMKFLEENQDLKLKNWKCLKLNYNKD